MVWAIVYELLPTPVLRGVLAGVTVAGAALANAGWPPAGGEPPVLLFIGGILALGGVVGVVDPELVKPEGEAGDDAY